MSKKNIFSAIFLILLSWIVIFLAGVRYGRQVEEVDQYYRFIQKLQENLVEKKEPELKTTQNLSFYIRKFDACGFDLPLPEEAEVVVEKKTIEVQLSQRMIFRAECGEKDLKLSDLIESEKREKVIFLGKEIEAAREKDYLHFTFKHPKKDIWYYFTVEQDIFPVISRSLEFF